MTALYPAPTYKHTHKHYMQQLDGGAAGGRKEFCKTTGRETFKKRFANAAQIKTHSRAQSVVVLRARSLIKNVLLCEKLCVKTIISLFKNMERRRKLFYGITSASHK
jgi:hypothetical protein